MIRVITRRVILSSDSFVVTSERLPEGDYLQVEVSDTGRGMSPETQARVFDPFFTTKAAGHGLGLAVVQGIIRTLHGAIRVVSAPGAGSTFQILLPSAEQAVEENPNIMSSVEEALPFRQKTVLVVEDEDFLRQAITTILRKAGFSTLEAGDGSVALDIIRTSQDQIDVLLLDITLPGTSSRDILAQAALETRYGGDRYQRIRQRNGLCVIGGESRAFHPEALSARRSGGVDSRDSLVVTFGQAKTASHVCWP